MHLILQTIKCLRFTDKNLSLDNFLYTTYFDVRYTYFRHFPLLWPAEVTNPEKYYNRYEVFVIFYESRYIPTLKAATAMYGKICACGCQKCLIQHQCMHAVEKTMNI